LKYENKLLTSELGDIFIRYTPFFVLYINYVNAYGDAEKVSGSLRSRRELLAQFLDLWEACEGGKLADFLIMPVQRIPRYLLLFRALDRAVGVTHSMSTELKKGLKQLEDIANKVNASFDEKESRLRVVQIQSHLDYPNLITPTRKHIMDGMLRKKNTSSLKKFTKCWFFLFNDMLMYTTVPTAKGHCKTRHALPLMEMSVHDVGDIHTSKTWFGFEIKNLVKTIAVYTSSREDKEKWLKALQENIGIITRQSGTIQRVAPKHTRTQSTPSTLRSPTKPLAVHTNLSQLQQQSTISLSSNSPSSDSELSPPTPISPSPLSPPNSPPVRSIPKKPSPRPPSSSSSLLSMHDEIVSQAQILGHKE